METIDTAKKALQVYEKALNTLLTGDLTPETIAEAAAGLKMLKEVLEKEEADRTVLIETLQDAKIKIIAEVSAFFKQELQKLLTKTDQTVEDLKQQINKRLNDIPDTQNFYQVYKYEKLVGGKLI